MIAASLFLVLKPCFCNKSEDKIPDFCNESEDKL